MIYDVGYSPLVAKPSNISSVRCFNQVWQKFLQNAEERPPSPQKREVLNLAEVTSPPCGTLEGVSFSFLDNSISSSPLVPCSLPSSLFCLTPLARPHLPKRDLAAFSGVQAVLETSSIGSNSDEVYSFSSSPLREPQPLPSSPGPNKSIPGTSHLSPQLEIPNSQSCEGDSQAPDVLSPLPSTPKILSPPRSVHLKGPTPSSGGSSVGTPPHLREQLKNIPDSPPSVDLQTPAIPKELVLRYPRSFGKMGSIVSPSTPIPETPGFGSSPPKTCKPLGVSKMGCFADSSEPSTPCVTAKKYFETPYATPGNHVTRLTVSHEVGHSCINLN